MSDMGGYLDCLQAKSVPDPLETQWEASGQHGDLDLLKPIASAIQFTLIVWHQEEETQEEG